MTNQCCKHFRFSQPTTNMALISALTRSLTNIKPSSALSSGLRPRGLARGHQVRGVTVSRLPVHHLDMGTDRSLAYKTLPGNRQPTVVMVPGLHPYTHMDGDKTGCMLRCG